MILADEISRNVNTSIKIVVDLPVNLRRFAENASVVGTFTTTDPDLGDTFGYSFLSGEDGVQFTIAGSQLLVGTTGLVFAAGATRSVSVRTTDGTIQMEMWLSKLESCGSSLQTSTNVGHSVTLRTCIHACKYVKSHRV